MRLLLFSERLARPFDEGIKNFALQLLSALRAKHQVQALTTFGEDLPDLNVRDIGTNRLLLSPRLWREIRRFRPELIVYVPTACATLFSFWRARLLGWYAGNAPVFLVALQVRQYGCLARLLMPHLTPERVVVQSGRTRRSLDLLGARVTRRLIELPPAVDLARLQPPTRERREALRAKWGLAQEAYVILHVGHLNRGRSVQVMPQLASQPGDQVVVAGSGSTPQDAELVGELRAAGARVITEYVEHIAELYQLADCYIFPVEGQTSAIDVPLSVLEAMACDLPVLTTPFGALPRLLAGCSGVRFAEGLPQMIAQLDDLRGLRGRSAETRQVVARYGWPQLAERLVDCAREPGASGGRVS